MTMANDSPTFLESSCPHGGSFIGMASLMRHLASGVDAGRLAAVAANNPDLADKLMGLSILFQLTGNSEMVRELQVKATKIRQHYHLLTADGRPGIRVLAIMTPGDMLENTPLDFLLEGSDVALDLLYVSLDLPFPDPLPEHDLLFISVAQSDRNQPLLERLEALAQSSPRPVLNRPDRIIALPRDRVSTLLYAVPGLEMPVSVRLPREILAQLQRGEQSAADLMVDGGFPLILRPVDSHAGEGLARVDTPESVGEYLNSTAAPDFFVARFVEYRSADGLYRKYRIALIDGRPYICHGAISENWMVHYKSAGMTESAEKRAEEERFMAGFDDDFAFRHKEPFRVISRKVGLDYAVMDCGETAEGKLLIFELDNMGLVHAADPVDLFPYKQPQMQKVFAAFREMLERAAKKGMLPLQHPGVFTQENGVHLIPGGKM